jgi:hypothetical protein
VSEFRAMNNIVPDDSKHILIIYDICVSGTAERLQRERAAWEEHANIEMFDTNHAALVIRPGGAWRLTK